MQPSKINLAFYCYPKKGAFEDFKEVARRISATDPRIAARVFSTQANLRAAIGSIGLAARPTLTIEMDRVRYAAVFRGRRLRHGGVSGKPEQLRILTEAGVPVPKWTPLEPDTVLSVADWGPYVVVKPKRGKRGAFVWIAKTGRVRYRPLAEYPEDHPGRRDGMMVQKFIYTGRWPTAYRVLTYFQEPLMAVRYEGRRDRPPLESAGDFGNAGGRSIVASALGYTIICIRDPDVLDLARRTHSAFPGIPSLGIDIVREHGSGKLYVLEVNPGGNSWTLTGDTGRQWEEQFGLDFYAQFGALDVISRVSAQLALRLAK